jgi:hypothetical protein
MTPAYGVAVRRCVAYPRGVPTLFEGWYATQQRTASPSKGLATPEVDRPSPLKNL